MSRWRPHPMMYAMRYGQRIIPDIFYVSLWRPTLAEALTWNKRMIKRHYNRAHSLYRKERRNGTV